MPGELKLDANFAVPLREVGPFARRLEALEVVAVHDDRLEMTEVRPDVLERQNARISHAAPSCDLNSTARHVNRDHFASACLQLKSDTPGRRSSLTRST